LSRIKAQTGINGDNGIRTVQKKKKERASKKENVNIFSWEDGDFSFNWTSNILDIDVKTRS